MVRDLVSSVWTKARKVSELHWRSIQQSWPGLLECLKLECYGPRDEHGNNEVPQLPRVDAWFETVGLPCPGPTRRRLVHWGRRLGDGCCWWWWCQWSDVWSNRRSWRLRGLVSRDRKRWGARVISNNAGIGTICLPSWSFGEGIEA